MSTSKIKAGKAVVELSLYDRIDKGLNAAKKKLQGFADGVKSYGSRLALASAGVIGGLGGFVSAASAIAGPLQDLSESSGVTASELTALKFAGDQVGVGLEALTGGLRTLAKFTAAVEAHSKKAEKTLNQLGITSSAFLAATPVQRLAMIADGLQRISDPALRAALAMAVLGKNGFDLQRLLAGGADGLNALLARAAELGVVISDEDIAKADNLGDSWAELVAQGKALVFQIGNAFSDVLLGVFEVMKPLAAATIVAVQANRGLIITLGTLAVVGLAAGWAIYQVGMFVQALIYIIQFGQVVLAVATAAWGALGAVKTYVLAVSTALSAALTWLSGVLTAEGLAALWAAATTWLFNSAMAAAAAVAAVLASPLFWLIGGLVLLGATLVAGAFYWLFWTQSGQAAIASVVAMLGVLWSVATTTFAGIMDAIIAGNWQLAGQIMMAGLNVAWQMGIALLKSTWQIFVANIKTTFADGMLSLIGIARSTAQQIEAALGPMLKALGINPKGASKALGMVGQGVSAYKKSVTDGLAKDLTKNGAEVGKAMADLNRLRGQAAKDRADQAAKFKLKIPKITLPTGDFSGAGTEGGNFSTFSGFVAGMVSKVAVDTHAKRTADGVEKSNELLQQMLDEFEVGLGVS
jgi:hypothetical protein